MSEGPWLELSLRLASAEFPAVEAALEAMGALSVTLLDAADDPILEPGAGETPLWPELVVDALFPGDADPLALTATLRERVPQVAVAARWRTVADADWTRAWMDQYRPMRFGTRLWIYPSTIEPPADADAVVVRLDPGLAFGTGTHATTALCLQWLDSLALAGRRVLDYGCGSGILAIAALKLGAGGAVGVDNDPQALVASADNALRNGVEDRLATCLPGDRLIADGGFDVVVANILAGALIELAPTLCRAAAPGAPLALSGILAEQAPEIVARYAPWCDDLVIAQREDWVLVSGTRRASV